MKKSSSSLATRFLVSRLRSEIQKLKLQVFPGKDPGPLKWLGLILGFVDTAEGYLTDADSKSGPASDNLITSAETLCQIAYDSLLHASGAEATQIPHQVIAPFQRWVKRLQIDSTIFFRAEHAPNYELATFDYTKFVQNLNNPSPSLTAASSKINWPVLRVTVPGQAMGMLPHFAVVAHELGHAIQSRVTIDFKPHQASINACEIGIKARYPAYGTKDRVSFVTVLTSWFNEFVADAVGYLVAGPAFFFALSGFLELSGRGYGVSPTHPPSDLRRNLLVEALKEGTPSFFSVLNDNGIALVDDINSPHVARTPPIDDLYKELKQAIGDPVAAICCEISQVIRPIARDIYLETRNVVTKIDPLIIYSPSEFEKDVERHLQGISLLVPPIEFMAAAVSQPASFASILNVGWLALLASLDEIPLPSNCNGNEDTCRMEQLHELLLKAVELSEAKMLWEEQI